MKNEKSTEDKRQFFGKKFALFLSACIAAGLLSMGCHTAKGFGEDVEDAGDAIKDAVN